MLNNIQQNFKRFKIRHLLALIFLFVVALLAGFISQANQTFMNANFVKKYFTMRSKYLKLKLLLSIAFMAPALKNLLVL